MGGLVLPPAGVRPERYSVWLHESELRDIPFMMAVLMTKVGDRPFRFWHREQFDLQRGEMAHRWFAELVELP